MQAGFCCFAIIWKKYAEWACIIHEVMGVAAMLRQASLHLQRKQTPPWPERATVTLETRHQELRSPEVQLIMPGLSFSFSCTPSGCFASIFLFSGGSLSVDLPTVVVPSANCTIYPATYYSNNLYTEVVKTRQNLPQFP